MGIHTWFFKTKDPYPDWAEEYNDCFRICRTPEVFYSEIELNSLEETINFIESTRSKYSGFEHNVSRFPNGYMNKIKEFWEKYPDGLIAFGG